MARFRTRTSVVIVHNDKILSFRAVDPTNGKEYYFLPGGGIEPEETAPEAAERECLEETGYLIQVDTSSYIDKEYLFNWDGEDYDCLTLFYRGHLTSPLQQPRPASEPEYNKGVAWIPVEQIEQCFSYNQEIYNAIKSLI